MGRQFIAIIELDEEVAASRCESIGENLTSGEYLDFQMGQLKKEGIQLTEWAITDYDVNWEMYCLYLTAWAIDHSSEEYAGMAPAAYEEWLDNEKTFVEEDFYGK